MTLQADLFVGMVFHIARFPAARVWANLAGAVALDADITLGVAGLARLQVAPCLGRVVRLPVGGGVLLRCSPQRVVGLDIQGSLGKAAVALGAVLLVVAAVALLLVVLRLYRMDADEVAAMALWMRVPAEVLFFGIGAVQHTPLMAIETPGLVMALAAVAAGLARQNPVAAHKIGIMVG